MIPTGRQILLGIAGVLATALQTAAGTPSETIPVLRDCPDCPRMIRIQPCKYQMGSTPEETAAAHVRSDRAAAEQPRHEVQIGYPFAISRYELTVREFSVFARETGFTAAGCLVLDGKIWRMEPKADWQLPGFPVTGQHPATCLSYNDFQKYLDWLSARTGKRYRFPTEAEWEYVANSSTGSTNQCRRLNAADKSFHKAFPRANWPQADCDDGVSVAGPVGRYAANSLGVHDMAGNQAEFVGDCYAPIHDNAPIDGSARKVKPAICALRIVKGGSWAAEPGMVRPAVRMAMPMDVRGNGHGLRVVRELTVPNK